MTTRTNLERLFAPSSVAVVGASASQGKVGYQTLVALQGFAGDVFPINPKADEILGRRAYASLSELGRPLDLVLFAIPAAGCAAAVKEAIDCGCAGGLILSGGFAESGEPGLRVQEEIANHLSGKEFRLLGPNTAGFINRDRGLTASFVPAAGRIPGGQIAVVAQSAGVNLTVGFLIAKLGYGVSCAVGLGNAMDVDAADVLEFLAAQPATKAIALHLEGVQDGRRLYETLRRVTPTKPVVALTVGRQDVGAFAQSHTGNLIGSFALRTQALSQAGAVVVETTEQLAAAAAVLSLGRLHPKLQPGVGILTAQAGPGLLMLDQLKSRGVSVPSVQAETHQRIRELLPPMTYTKNPVDTGRPGASFAEVLIALGGDPQIDALIAYALDEPAALQPGQVLPPAAEQLGKPVLFGTMGPVEQLAPVIASLRARGLYVAQSPEQLAAAASVLVQDAAGQARLVRQQQPLIPSQVELPACCDEYSAKQLLRKLGIQTAEHVACQTHAEALSALKRLKKPVVVKILAAQIAHKTELGGVLLDIEDERSLSAALHQLDEIPVEGQRRYLVEEMAPPGLELIVGAVRDASFGPTVMLGLGGTLAEAIADTVTRLAPLSLDDAAEMVGQLRCARVFDGFRGSAKLDRAELARVLVRLGDLIQQQPGIQELEINPLRLYERGALALDALLLKA